MNDMKTGIVIAIDGPAASGKTSVTKLLAQRLQFNYVDTGALYRGVAYLCDQSGLDSSDPDFEQKAAQLAIEGQFEFHKDRLFCAGIDISGYLRSTHMSHLASWVSSFPKVRQALRGLQRRLGCQGNSILEGRDIGTVIFPDADLKVFLSAPISLRAQRRLEQLTGETLSLEQVQKDIQKRDDQDTKRAIAPLSCAKDAVELDTSDLSLEQVVDKIEALVKQSVVL